MLLLIVLFAILTGIGASVFSYRALVVVGVVSVAIFALALLSTGWGALATTACCFMALVLQQASFLAAATWRNRIGAEIVRIRGALRCKTN
jgi:hypothetical protein